VLLPRLARAQQVDVRAIAQPDTVEVGESFVYTLSATVHGPETPTELAPGATSGFTKQGSSGSAPTRMRMNINGVQSETNGLTTSFQLRADRVGTFKLGPGSVTIGGKRHPMPTASVTVVARGSAPHRPRTQSPFDPFGSGPSTLDPFKGLFDLGDDNQGRDLLPPADPKLALDAPRGQVSFLHAVIDKTRAVVGEQVTLLVYKYDDPYSRQGRPADVHEATTNDFVKRSLLEDDTHGVGAGIANVGGKPWNVQLVRKTALFPLKAGHLLIEPMSLTLPQARVGLRESERLAVDVTEPPAAGRPPGYALGDVGDMSLQSTVTPRAIERDDAVGVTVELRGTGNLPAQLTLPTVPGVEWLEPQVREKLGATKSDRFGGTRTFSYVVRIHKDGPVDLGEIRLPYYDADRRTYNTTRASIGVVVVKPGPGRDAGVDPAETILADLPRGRATLEGPRAESFLADRPWFWLGIFGAPLGCAMAMGGGELFRRARERRASRSPSPDRVARERRAEAGAACDGTDGGAAMGAIARAVEADVVARTGVNLRGTPTDAGRAELEDAGAPAEVAKEIAAVLAACADARFSPDGVDVAAARELWTRARAALDALSELRERESRAPASRRSVPS